MAENTSPVESKEDFGSDPAGVVRRWSLELEMAEKEDKRYLDNGRKVIDRYKDKRQSSTDDTVKFNVLWSNTEILIPALYARTPKPEVERRFGDRDPLGRVASTVLERAMSYILSAYDFDGRMRSAVKDYALVGRGNAWVRYVPVYGDPLESEGGDQMAPIEESQPLREVVYETVVCDHVAWNDFRHSPARDWDEVRWVARRAYMTKDEIRERFGKEIADQIPLDYTPEHLPEKDAATPERDAFKKAIVWEIWDKPSRKVFWIAPGYKDKPLDERDDPLRLRDFFPCPRPLLGTLSPDSLSPIADYILYQDQARELDILTGRIAALTQALKVAGLCDAGTDATMSGALTRLMSSEYDNVVIPVQGWASFREGGGAGGAIEWLPVGQIASVLKELYAAREAVKRDLYEISGISDIVRGMASGPRATATEQRIKGQFATLRLSDRQQEVQRFARDLIRIKAEVVAEKFAPETLALMSGIELVGPDAAGFIQAVELLRSDALRSFRVDIETDSTIQPDQEADKQSRIEFITAVGGFLQQALPVASAVPELKGVLGETLMFAIRGFKAGRSLEASFEEAIAQLSQPQPPQGDPGAQQAQAEMQAEAAKLQLEQQKVMAKVEADRMRMQADIQMQQEKAAAEIALDREKMAQKFALDQERMAQEMRLKAEQARLEAELERQIAQSKMAAQQAGAVVNAMVNNGTTDFAG